MRDDAGIVWTERIGDGPVVAVALHHGHALHPAVARHVRIDEAARLREEDPRTGPWTAIGDVAVVVHRSRFEVDLNRPRERAVYATPAAAWGLDVWGGPPPPAVVAHAERIHDAFYARMRALLDRVVERHGAFALLDVHSYNHRRGGPDAPPAPTATHPDFCLGTARIDRTRWGPVVDALVAGLRQAAAEGGRVVAENTPFRGGWLTRWVLATYPDTGCPIAVEVKKRYVDEWTGVVDADEHTWVGRVLAAATGVLRSALAGHARAFRTQI